MDGEERERAELAAQIARAKAKEGDKASEDTGLQKAEGEKITLSLFPAAPEGSSSTKQDVSPVNGEDDSVNAPTVREDINATAGPSKPTISFGSFGVKTPSTTSAAPVANPLKRPAPGNIFKAAKSTKTDSDAGSNGKKGYISEAERLMKEDQARRANRQKGYTGMGPTRTGDGGRRFVLQ